MLSWKEGGEGGGRSSEGKGRSEGRRVGRGREAVKPDARHCTVRRTLLHISKQGFRPSLRPALSPNLHTGHHHLAQRLQQVQYSPVGKDDLHSQH